MAAIGPDAEVAGADDGAAAPDIVLAPPESLLELLLLQQTQGESGVRLTFNKDLAQRITLLTTPYHYCGMSGNTALAAYLHYRGIAYDRDFTIASFSANGTTDSSPWQKAISVSAKETARLAGNAKTAAVLALIEGGVPLRWSRHNHSEFPDEFRQKVRPMMEALVKSPGFAALPGPVRTQAVDLIISDMARTSVWGHVSSGCEPWYTPPEPMEGEEEMWAQAARLPLPRSGSKAGDAGVEEALPQYQFRMGLATQSGRRKKIFRLLSRATVGAAAVHVARSFGCTAILPNTGLFVAGFIAPLPALLVLSSVKLHQCYR